MNPDEKPRSLLEAPPAYEDGLPLHERIFYAGVVILVAGLTGAALIYWLTADSAVKKAEIEYANPRAYEFQIERLGGKATVYVVRFNEWFTGLWAGPATRLHCSGACARDCAYLLLALEAAGGGFASGTGRW